MENAQTEPKPKNTLRKVLLTLFVLVLATGGFLAWNFFLKPNVPARLTNEYVHFPTGSTLDDMVRILKEENFIKDEASFRMMAERMSLKGRAGRFKIKPGMSSFQLARFLRSGEQSAVKLVLVNERLPEHIAGKAARFIEADSLSILSLLNDPVYLDSIGFTPETILSLFIPNTYEFFWNTSPRKFVERMIKEHDKFWQTNGRQAKADALGLTREQVYTVASIVERETNANSEKARIAGVYLNRVALGMPLQADPTLVFASRDWESRDLAKYKTLDSPYNTYMYPGLPPGPISMASIPSLDAVLNREKHDYVFFCALGDGSGLHSFAVTYDAHLVNVKIYKENLIKRGMGL
jgi:UPF0755 protein